MLGVFIKKLVSRFFFPVPVLFVLLVAALLLLWFTKRQRAGKVLLTVAVIAFAALAYAPLPDFALHRLEYRHLPVAPRATGPRQTTERDHDWIVVLGSGFSTDPELPAASRVSPAYLARFFEGVRLAKVFPKAKLLLSVPDSENPRAKHELVDELAAVVALERERVVIMTDALDTVDEARMAKETVGAATVLLVTSASHMARSLALFKGAGVACTPSPADYNTKRPEFRDRGPSADLFFPRGSNLFNSERVVYEQLGSVWARLRGQTAVEE